MAKTHYVALLVVFLILIAGVVGVWQLRAEPTVESAPEAATYVESEAGFDGSAAPATVDDSGEPAVVAATTTRYLPPIPEPENEDGRTRWSAYWEPMTPEELLVYGPRERVPGPAQVGIQVGHWQLENVPEELQGLQDSTGAVSGEYTEQEIVLRIGELVRAELEAAGVVVDFLPATVPIDYEADAFISIHADGSNNGAANGFKIAGPRHDFSGRSEALVADLYDAYGEATGLRRDDSNITRRMSGYYAFNWRRYDHALHPQTPAAIVETGFVTSAIDRELLVGEPERAARGIAEGVRVFLEREGVLQ